MAVLGGSSGEAIGIPPLPASNYLKGENCMRGVVFVLLNMGQDPVDDVLVLDASDDFDRSAAAAADFDFCIEYSLESLSPSQSGMALGGGASFCVGDRLDAFPTLRWCDQPTTAVVRCQDAMVASEIDPGLGNQCRQSGYEIHRLECYLCCPIPVGRLQGIDHLADGAE